MYEERQSIGYDASTSEQITRIVLVWEPEKESQDEFLKTAAALYPGTDQHIMHRCIHIYERTKTHQPKSSKKDNDSDYLYDQPKKKKPRF